MILVIVQGVLEGYGVQGGEPCMLNAELFGLHSLNNCLMLLSPNMVSLLAFTQKYHLLAHSWYKPAYHYFSPLVEYSMCSHLLFSLYHAICMLLLSE